MVARKGALAYVALGSNLGDRLANLQAAASAIDSTHGLTVLRMSPVYETAPVGPPQPDYLNAVLEVDACKAPFAHLEALLSIERRLGRLRGERWGARLIDLDLLWQGGLVLHGGSLDLPHPRLAERSFVLAPLADLAPDLRIGTSTVRELLLSRPGAERLAVRRLP